MNPTPKNHDLVLVGGGHTHALLIRRLGMKPIPGVRVTLVSENRLTPYSGMLPGLVAGHYDAAETHIDLNQLCQRAGVHFIEGRLDGLDPERQTLSIEDQPRLSYDVVSLDTGSTPNLDLPGAHEHAVGVKPVSHFHATWQAMLRDSQANTEPQHWGVVGAGAGGVELVLAIAHRLRQQQHIRLHLFYSGQQPLQGYPDGVVRAAQDALTAAGVNSHSAFKVAKVTASGVSSHIGAQITLDKTLLVTPASAPDWPVVAGLDTANGGFVAVNKFLQSTSHPTVFAAGDVAEMINDPRPKAGVYAVRQAPTLYHNLRAYFAEAPMRPLRLQKQFLSLLSLGSQRATGSRNRLTVTGGWVWRWKDKIDRDFMARFNDFRPSDMSAPKDDTTPVVMHCAGCGSKLGPALLQDTL
ncbi:MAG: FAD-dependent oxidoreductase, partial [Natronospirillum sp.]